MTVRDRDTAGQVRIDKARAVEYLKKATDVAPLKQRLGPGTMRSERRKSPRIVEFRLILLVW